jgi:hypothetical protein
MIIAPSRFVAQAPHAAHRRAVLVGRRLEVPGQLGGGAGRAALESNIGAVLSPNTQRRVFRNPGD